MNRIRPSKLIIDTTCFKHNVLEIKKLISTETSIMPIVKATGYGTNLNQLIHIFDELNIDKLGVAIADEGILLRDLGFKGLILVVNQPYIEEIPTFYQYNLTPNVSLIEFAKELNAFCIQHSMTMPIHLEIDSGMGRTGIMHTEFKNFIDHILPLNNLIIEGISTHFACSDCESEYTYQQIKHFNTCVDLAKTYFSNTLKLIHAANSAGIISYPEAHYNLVRPGLILYGYLPSPELVTKINLKPTATLKSKISFIKQVPTGTNISYGRRFITNRDSIIATIPLGYDDGIKRVLTNNGHVCIHGQRFPIVGTVCMDSFMVDVTDSIHPITINDTVFIWDNKVVTLDEIAENCNTINYEILCTISDRIPREFI